MDYRKKIRELFEAELPKQDVELDERCWDGYEEVPGKEPYSKGSCRKAEEEVELEEDEELAEGGRCTGPTKKASSTAKGKKWMQCVSDGKGGHKRVHWGQKGVRVTGKSGDTKRKKSFKARHGCSDAKSGTPKAQACKDWAESVELNENALHAAGALATGLMYGTGAAAHGIGDVTQATGKAAKVLVNALGDTLGFMTKLFRKNPSKARMKTLQKLKKQFDKSDDPEEKEIIRATIEEIKKQPVEEFREGEMSELDIVAEEIAERFQEESQGDPQIMNMLMNAVHEKLGMFEESGTAVGGAGGIAASGGMYKGVIGRTKRVGQMNEEELEEFKASLTEEDVEDILNEYGGLADFVQHIRSGQANVQGVPLGKSPDDYDGVATTDKNYRGPSFGADT